MKWFQRKKNIKKRDEHSTYLKVENGRVVPVTGDDQEKEIEKESLHREYDETEESAPDTQASRWLKWLWLLVILGLGYGTIQLFGGLASENQETFKLQEIQRNTLKIPETETTPDTKEEPAPFSVEDKATEWREAMKDSFTKDEEPKDVTNVPPVLEDKGIDAADHKLLFEIRSLDEQGTQLLEEIRESSVLHIQGDISRGQYLLRLQAMDLQMKHYNQRVAEVKANAVNKPTYSTLLDYVSVKKESLQYLTVELHAASTSSVAPVFNGYVDIHNGLTKEADEEFVRKLKEIGYDAYIKNGVIEYQ